LFDKRLFKAKSLKEALEKKEEEVMFWVHAANDSVKERNELKKQIEELERKLMIIGNLATDNAV
jgi:chromosome segregation ATPase